MRYRLLGPDGAVLEEGEAVTEVTGGALVVAPPFGQVLRVAAADIVEIGEPEPYLVRLVLADGPALELTGLGALRTQVLAELADARAADVTATMLLDGIGRPEEFPGWAGDSAARLLLYDDALVVLPDAGTAEKVPYPFVRGVSTDPSGYRVTVDVAGREPLVLHRMASRTTEFVTLLSDRYRAAAGRTAAFLGVLLPGLPALGLRTVAGLLRDGLAAARADLDRVDAGVWPALAEAATLPERRAGLRLMADLGAVWIGFKQVVSVERPADGVQPWHDHAIRPDLGDHGAPGSAFPGGLAGVWGAGMVAGGPPSGFDGPFQAMGAMLAYRMLGTGTAGGNQHRMLPRANVERGRLTPAHTDLDALSVGGGEPTVRAFALCLTPGGRLVYEVLNEADHATYVYHAADHAADRAAGPDAVVALNRCLDLLGFRVEGIHADADSAGSRYRGVAGRLPALRLLREAYVGRVSHGEGWADRLGHLLG
jgi:hypothetical protein